MRVRRLQRRMDGVWVDDAYVYENRNGQVTFRYNLTWERVGSNINGLLRTTGTPIETIETVISPNEDLRWLPIELIENEQAPLFLAALDQVCDIPKLQPIFA